MGRQNNADLVRRRDRGDRCVLHRLCAVPAPSAPAAAPSAVPVPPGAPARPATALPGTPAASARAGAAAAPRACPAFDTALLNAATALFSKALLPPGDDKIELVIDPLIDGVSGAQSAASHLMEKRLTELAQKSYPRFKVQPFNTRDA